MPLLLRDSVRAFLPAFALAFCLGSGESGTGAAPGTGTGTGNVPAAVVSANQAPSISGYGAGEASVGIVYEFQPEVSDADGDALTFTALNLPNWASLNPATGQIIGTPQAGDVGQYESIIINVADAEHRTASDPFSITVLAPANGVATLEWEAPPAKVDGSPLDDLAGYRIVYGRKADDLDHSIYVGDPAQHSYEFATLDSGIWYFAVIGVNANGLEGPPSIAAMKSI